jgi:hypothetical protein
MEMSLFETVKQVFGVEYLGDAWAFFHWDGLKYGSKEEQEKVVGEFVQLNRFAFNTLREVVLLINDIRSGCEIQDKEEVVSKILLGMIRFSRRYRDHQLAFSARRVKIREAILAKLLNNINYTRLGKRRTIDERLEYIRTDSLVYEVLTDIIRVIDDIYLYSDENRKFEEDLKRASKNVISTHKNPAN